MNMNSASFTPPVPPSVAAGPVDGNAAATAAAPSLLEAAVPLNMHPPEQKVRRKPKYPPAATTGAAKKSDPPGPCTECGKRFWSSKALYGHMRCHPERTWRGINPPPNLNRGRLPQQPPEEDCLPSSSLPVGLLPQQGTLSLLPSPPSHHHNHPQKMTEEEHDVAASLLLLAQRETTSQRCDTNTVDRARTEGSLGISRNEKNNNEDGEMVINLKSHKCSICSRVFSSGRALGGHKRCHCSSGNGDYRLLLRHPLPPPTVNYLDLNFLPPPPLPPPLPPPATPAFHMQGEDPLYYYYSIPSASASSSSATLPALDLRLGL